MITILHRGGVGPNDYRLHRGGGVCRDPQKWLRNIWMTPNVHVKPYPRFPFLCQPLFIVYNWYTPVWICGCPNQIWGGSPPQHLCTQKEPVDVDHADDAVSDDDKESCGHDKNQIIKVAFIDHESHSKHLNFPLHGSWDHRPPCGAAFKGPVWNTGVRIVQNIDLTKF